MFNHKIGWHVPIHKSVSYFLKIELTIPECALGILKFTRPAKKKNSTYQQMLSSDNVL